MGGYVGHEYEVSRVSPNMTIEYWAPSRRNGELIEYSAGEGYYEVVSVEPIEDDLVNHPSHYTQYPVEVIELTEHMPFLEGNVVKYVARAPFKGNKVQDLEKAAWYLNRAIEKAKAENGD